MRPMMPIAFSFIPLLSRKGVSQIQENAQPGVGTETGNCHILEKVVSLQKGTLKKRWPNLLFLFYFSAGEL